MFYIRGTAMEPLPTARETEIGFGGHMVSAERVLGGKGE